MAWEAEPIKHFLEFTHIGKDEREHSSSQEFTPERDQTMISHWLSEDDAELRVRPYTLEHLKQLVSEDYDSGVVNELFVGVRDGTSIAYVGTIWAPKGRDSERVNQYFFRDDKPSAFNFGYMSGPGWPLNRPAVLDERLARHFETLKGVRPDVTDSLERCMIPLTWPGPEYEGASDGRVSFKLQM